MITTSAIPAFTRGYDVTSTNLSGGWVRHQWVSTRDDYWADPFVAVSASVIAANPGIEDDLRVNPIRQYDSRGIGPVEWINAVHDRAFILDADGGWHSGGRFHVWYSSGGGSLPREITKSVIHGPAIDAGDHVGWQDQLREAIEQVEAYAGMVAVENAAV